jgi:hypothetical protein
MYNNTLCLSFCGFIVKKNLPPVQRKITTMCPTRNEEQEGQQEHNNNDCGNILVKKIDSWSNFDYALREENRLVFNKMLTECKENEDCIRAASSKDEYFSAESLFMALILQQQKTINELIAKVSECKERSSKITRWMDKKDT